MRTHQDPRSPSRPNLEQYRLTSSAAQAIAAKAQVRQISFLRLVETAGAAMVADVWILPENVSSVADQYKVLPTTTVPANEGFHEGGDGALLTLPSGSTLWARASSGAGNLLVGLEEFYN